MIRKPVKLYLEQHLIEIGCAKVFTDPKDAGVAKPKEWALVSMPEAARYETKNEKLHMLIGTACVPITIKSLR